MGEDDILANDVEKIIIETDEENPAPIVIFDRTEEPFKISTGYRVRISFVESSQS